MGNDRVNRHTLFGQVELQVVERPPPPLEHYRPVLEAVVTGNP